MGGSSTASTPLDPHPGVYGVQGVPASTNVPGGRSYSVSWTDSAGNLWLFGGSVQSGSLNDLWEYDVSANEWTWISGSSVTNEKGVYGSLGVFASANCPGARDGAIGWVDNSGNLWLFGGSGYGSNATPFTPGGILNDLWEFNVNSKEWAWISGSSAPSARGIYGSKNISSANSVPGARTNAVSWIDKDGNLWLFGGDGYDSNGLETGLNDLWEFNIASKEWTWVGGSNTYAVNVVQAGVYGTRGVPSAGNLPGTRINATSWVDKSGNFWLFGGAGVDSSAFPGNLNDLWEFNPTTREWAWISGSNFADPSASYGTEGAPSANNVPGGRTGATGWAGNEGSFWIFGGNGNSGSYSGQLNDLWTFNPNTLTWTWMNGNEYVGPPTYVAYGTYGTLGVPAPANSPEGRFSSVSWKDDKGDLWLFGGRAFVSNLNGDFNDLWRYQP